MLALGSVGVNVQQAEKNTLLNFTPSYAIKILVCVTLRLFASNGTVIQMYNAV